MPNEPSHPSASIKMRELLVRSVREVERLRTELAEHESRAREPVAIVGIGLRAPGGVGDLAQLWSLLAAGHDLVREVPPERWDPRSFYDPEPGVPGRTYVNQAAFMTEVDRFDPAFFGISPREARSLDPQHRVLLEATWEALERARIVPASLASSRTGVYVGAGPSEYARLQAAEAGDAYAVMGTHPSFAAGRVAFHLGLHGPALTIDTACSSSLVALHLARAALLADECELALAAGVQVMAGPEGFVHLSSTRTVAPDGRCKTFSAAADGYGRGEGVVVLALARQSRAEAAGYPILGLIRGSAVNHDGASNGITAPNGGAQQRVIRAALDDAKLEPAAIDLVECHGTGTQLGDPIEVQALGAVYGRARGPEQAPLMIGTVKTNLGHLESAAGLAGVAKLLTAFEHDAIAPSLRTTPANPLIDWDSLGVEVVDRLRPWPRCDDRPRLAAVSAFGLSGTNAHVILEEPPTKPARGETTTSLPSHVPLLISGRSEAAMQAQLRALRAHIDAPSENPRELVDLGAALALTRQHFEHRACVIAKPGQARALLDELDALADEGHRAAAGISNQLGPRLAKQAWMFSGQGAQYPGMGRALYQAHVAFRISFDACCEGFGHALGQALRELVLGDPDPARAEALDQTGLTQPALFAYELSLARLLESWGLRPAYVMGHSIGELVAAHFAGLWSLADACKLVAARARLMQDLTPVVAGAMIAVEAPESTVLELLADRAGVEIAGLNGPRATVVSGDAPAIEALSATLEAAGHRCRALRVSRAFHSHHMDPAVDAFEALAASVDYQQLSVPLISTRTGELSSAAELATPRYWARQLREAVRFGPAVVSAEALGTGLLVEIGPHAVLGPMVHASLSEAGRAQATIVAFAHRKRDAIETSIRGLATLHCAGVEVDWQAYFSTHEPEPVALPTYAFVRQRYWTETQARALGRARASTSRYALAGEHVELSDGAALHTLDIGPQLQPYLGDHTVYGTLVVPGSFYLAVLLAVGHAHWPEAGVELREVEFIRALSFAGLEDRVALHVELRQREAIVFSIADGERREHARARIGPVEGPDLAALVAEQPPASRTGEPRDRAALARALETVEIEWGPRWWWLDSVAQLGPREAQGHLRPPAGETGDDAPVPCGFIDNSFGLQAWARPDEMAGSTTAQLPFSVERLVWFGPREAAATTAALRCDRVESDSTTSTLRYWDAEGQPLALLEGFTTRRAPRERLLEANVAQHLYRTVWRPVEAAGVKPKPTIVHLGAGHPSLAQWLGDTEEIAEPTHLAYHLDGEGQTPLELSATLLAAVQRWLARPKLGLTVITRGAVSVDAGGVTDLSAAPSWGLIRAASSEHPDRTLALLDCDPALEREAQREAIERAIHSDEPELALREGKTLRPRLARATPTQAIESIDFSRGSVLITGASGHIGRHLARHLVEVHGARDLVLASRRGLAASELAELTPTLEAAGAEVHVTACDLSQREAVAALLAEHPPRAIIHCAGVLDDAPIANLDAPRLEHVFAAKLDGARHLDELSAALELDAFILCSSASAILGAAGQANYAAANAGLDALASARRAVGRPGLALAWGPWSGGGMAAKLDDAHLRRRGVRALSPDRALALFDRALAHADATLIPIELDRERLRDLAERGERVSPILGDLVGRERSQAPVETPVEFDATSVRERIAREVGAILELPPNSLEPERDLRDYGLDSLMALELRNRLQRLLGTGLPSTVVLDHPTCAALEQLVLDHLPDATEPDTPETPADGLDDKDRVTGYLALQAQGVRESDPAKPKRAVLGLLELFQRFIDDDFESGRLKMRATLMALREHSDHLGKPATPAPVRLVGPSKPEACVYAIPAFGFPSSPLQFIQIAAECREIAGGEVALWSAANPGIETGVAIPASLEAIVDYHVAAYDEVCTQTGVRPLLKGFSSGGWLATRVAARLEARGQPATGLVLLDSSHPYETSSVPIEKMFVSNAISHHVETGGDDELFLHELTGMLALMGMAFDEWTEVSVSTTPALHIRSEVGFNFPRWDLVFVTDPARHWGPHIRDLSVVHSPVDHYAMLTRGAHEAAVHTCAYARRWASAPSS